LYNRHDVDRERIVLAGGSFGALFSPALAASDERISAVAIFFGAGDLETLVAANLELPAPVRPVATWLGATLVSPMEPLKYIDRVAPRPVFILSGTDDPRMPEVCGRALQERAGEPKTIRWLPVGHVNIRSPEFHEEILELFLAWLVEIDVISADEGRTLLRDPGNRTDDP
jgi:dienelactone hydrolase